MSDVIQPALSTALQRGEIGVQVAANAGGRQLIDGWAGVADQETGREVDGSTLFAGFSIGKALTSLGVHLQAERGLVDYDAPVAEYWTEYGNNGKEAIKVAHVLSHEAGVPMMPEGTTPERQADWNWVVERLAQLTPIHKPGTAGAYHNITFGFILGEVVRRTDPQHRPYGRFVQEEILAPLGITDCWLGIPASEEPRVATLYQPELPPAPPNPSPHAAAIAPKEVALNPSVYNQPVVRESCIPSTGVISNARALARLFALIAGLGELEGVRLFSEERVRSFATPRGKYNRDVVLPTVPPVGIGGFWVGGQPWTGLRASIVMSPGAGGVLAWADLETGVSAGLLHNRMFGPPFPPGQHPFKPIGDAIANLGAAAAR
jgi:CubicO group peptidase (beta-lactamase class C family)